jgi:MFS transporter, SP family, sugar:H+ symporter
MAKVGNAFENSVILVTVGVIAIIANSLVITHIGRRRVFLMSGMFLCGLTQLLIAIVYTVHPGTVSTGKAIVGLSVLYLLAYNVRLSLLLTCICQNKENGLVNFRVYREW